MGIDWDEFLDGDTGLPVRKRLHEHIQAFEQWSTEDVASIKEKVNRILLDGFSNSVLTKAKKELSEWEYEKLVLKFYAFRHNATGAIGPVEALKNLLDILEAPWAGI